MAIAIICWSEYLECHSGIQELKQWSRLTFRAKATFFADSAVFSSLPTCTVSKITTRQALVGCSSELRKSYGWKLQKGASPTLYWLWRGWRIFLPSHRHYVWTSFLGASWQDPKPPNKAATEGPPSKRRILAGGHLPDRLTGKPNVMPARRPKRPIAQHPSHHHVPGRGNNRSEMLGEERCRGIAGGQDLFQMMVGSRSSKNLRNCTAQLIRARNPRGPLAPSNAPQQPHDCVQCQTDGLSLQSLLTSLEHT